MFKKFEQTYQDIFDAALKTLQGSKLIEKADPDFKPHYGEPK